MKILRFLIEISTKYICKFNKNRKICNTTDDVVKINLGCGLAVASGWINVDGSLNALVASFPRFLYGIVYRITGANRYYTRNEYCSLLACHKFIHHDLAYGIPIEDKSADFVFSSHFLEHLRKEEAINLLSESYRVLKNGGTIRISVPDLEYAIKLYRCGKKEQMLETYFFIDDKGSDFSRHKYMYDFELLKKKLEDAGFKKVIRCSYREGTTPDLEVLDNRPEDSLYVEAVKLND